MSKRGKVVKRTFQEIEDSFIASYMEKYTALYEASLLPVEAEPVALALECSPALPESLCTGEGCKKKITKGCHNNMCFSCCYDMPAVPFCPGHYAAIQKRKDDDRYIEEGLSTKKLKCGKYHSFEEKFTAFGQTVVVWCQKDFNQNKSFNGEVFKTFLREEKRKELMKRRHNISTTTSSSTSASFSTSTSSSTSFQSIETPSNPTPEINIKIEKNGQKTNMESDPSSESNSTYVRTKGRKNISDSGGGVRMIKKENNKGNEIIYRRAEVGAKATARHQKVLGKWSSFITENSKDSKFNITKQFKQN